MLKKGMWVIGAALTAALSLSAAENSASRRELTLPFFDAKFGVFIHFGLYSVPEGEWQGKKEYGEWFQIQTQMPYEEYAKFAAQFNPLKFDAREWVRNIKNAGVKYMVVTTKHHDGFAMYDTKLTDYNVVRQTPWARDPLRELAAACGEEGVMLCFYYSIPDWYSLDFPRQYSQRWGEVNFHGRPNADADLEKYIAYMKAQIREILTNYGPIGALWFDDGGSFEKYSARQRAELIHAREITDLVHELQPRCAISDRLGLPADYDTPEQSIPAGRPSGPFETCMSLNRHWGFNKNDHDWKSPLTVIRQLVTVSGKGGNYLLGIGAPADGSFPPSEAALILQSVGAWLKINGDSVYGTTVAPLKRWRWGTLTRKDNILYLHNFRWPADGALTVPLKNTIVSARWLGDPSRPLSVTRSERGATVSVPAQMPDEIDTVIALEVENLDDAVEVPGADNLALNAPVEVSSEWAGRDTLKKSHITDGRNETSWAAADGESAASVTVDLRAEREVAEILLDDAPFLRTRKFTVEAADGEGWRVIASGTTIGEEQWLTLERPVRARRFRVNIVSASDTPTLAEFQVFGK
ncbi:MAG: alpha-L-fucosidase [Verrucomicrobiales bacterium]|jgi:alpha-L-fucosidase|nr:alpha-L-fucosidase [Verrucomicrobiales bacterium]